MPTDEIFSIEHFLDKNVDISTHFYNQLTDMEETCKSHIEAYTKRASFYKGIDNFFGYAAFIMLFFSVFLTFANSHILITIILNLLSMIATSIIVFFKPSFNFYDNKAFVAELRAIARSIRNIKYEIRYRGTDYLIPKIKSLNDELTSQLYRLDTLSRKAYIEEDRNEKRKHKEEVNNGTKT